MASSLRRRNWKIGLLAILLTASFLARDIYNRSAVPPTPTNPPEPANRMVGNPTSKFVINPVTGKYDKDLAAWILPITSDYVDLVTVDMGDRAGVANTIQEDVLFILAPTIRMHPKAKEFIVSWSMICCTDGGTSDGGQKLIYRRDVGEVSYRSSGYAMSTPYDTTTIIATGVTDASIHYAALRHRSYSELGQS